MQANCDLCVNKWKCGFLTEELDEPHLLRVHSRYGVQEILNKDRIIKTCGDNCLCAYSSDSVPLGCRKQDFYNDVKIDCVSFTLIQPQ